MRIQKYIKRKIKYFNNFPKCLVILPKPTRFNYSKITFPIVGN